MLISSPLSVQIEVKAYHNSVCRTFFPYFSLMFLNAMMVCHSSTCCYNQYMYKILKKPYTQNMFLIFASPLMSDRDTPTCTCPSCSIREVFSHSSTKMVDVCALHKNLTFERHKNVRQSLIQPQINHINKRLVCDIWCTTHSSDSHHT